MKVTPDTAQAIEAMRQALQNEFRCDYAFSVLGQGHLIAASNNRDGEITAQTHGETKDLAIAEAQRALNVIREYSRKYCTNPDLADQVSDEHLISAGVAKLTGFDTDLLIGIAANLIEEVNYHDLAKIVRTFEVAA
jgi:hypothetical protein